MITWMSVIYSLGYIAGILHNYRLTRQIRELEDYLIKQQAVIDRYKKHSEKLMAITRAGIITRTMLEGGRPIATKAPEGMTLEEAQGMIDEIFLTLRPRDKDLQ